MTPARVADVGLHTRVRDDPDGVGVTVSDAQTMLACLEDAARRS